MKFGWLMVAGGLWLAGAMTVAHAQSPEEARAEIPALVRDAFDAPYGKALIAELGKSLRKDADPACLTAKGLAPDQLEPRGRDLIVKWGVRMREIYNSFVDREAYDEKLAASAGRGVSAELKRLRDDKDVKRFIELERPIRLANIADTIFEQFDRHLLVQRIKLKAVSPLGTGNEALLNMNPKEATEEKIEKFLAANKSPALKKYLELSQHSAAATVAAMRKEETAKAGPSRFFGGVEADLAELCIGPAKK
jgi:hypothetical protein